VPVKGNLDSVQLLQREVQVACQQVSGAGRYQAHRDSAIGKAIGNNPDRAVATRSNDKIGLLGDGLLGHCPARILRRGLQPKRAGPPPPQEILLH
jgi:hypothetical protein